MSEVLEAVRSTPVSGFEEVNREELEEMLNDGDATCVEDILDEENSDDGGGDAASGADDLDLRKVTTRKLSQILGVCTSFHEMIQNIEESEAGEREKKYWIFFYQISRNYQMQYSD